MKVAGDWPENSAGGWARRGVSESGREEPRRLGVPRRAGEPRWGDPACMCVLGRRERHRDLQRPPFVLVGPTHNPRVKFPIFAGFESTDARSSRPRRADPFSSRAHRPCSALPALATPAWPPHAIPARHSPPAGRTSRERRRGGTAARARPRSGSPDRAWESPPRPSLIMHSRASPRTPPGPSRWPPSSPAAQPKRAAHTARNKPPLAGRLQSPHNLHEAPNATIILSVPSAIKLCSQGGCGTFSAPTHAVTRVRSSIQISALH